MATLPRPDDVLAARQVLTGAARMTPAFPSETLTRRCGRPVWLKAENLQRTGSFKVRGALNRIAALSERNGTPASSRPAPGTTGRRSPGPHARQACAATVFMPEEAALAKVEATRGYGADVRLEGVMLDDALERALEHAAEVGAVLVHPFDDPLVVAGQGTIGVELVEQVDELETVVVPVGGGGLAAGIAIALGELRPEVRVVGVQAARCAPLAGETVLGFTIADGIAVKQPGALTRPILDERLTAVVTVTDEQIALAIVLLLERAKLVVEGAGAAAVAALLAGVVDGDGPVCCLLSGGNIDATVLVQVARHGLTQAGRYLVVRTRMADRPGQLAALLTRLASEEGANVVEVQHRREGVDIAVWETEIELTLLTRDEEHCRDLLADMASWGYPAVRVR